MPSTGIPRLRKDLRQDSFFSTTSTGSMKLVGTVKTVIEEDLLEPSSPRFVKATPTSHLPWSPPQDIPNLPPVANFALTPRILPQRPANKSKVASWICSVCRVQARTIDLERSLQCCNRNCGHWFHLRCVGLKDLPQGRYGWSCKECDPDDTNNGLFSINDNVEWQGDDEDVR
ncbi:Lysine Methyltransferase 2D [Friedmanniomyces endolithicus]|nr:Lysine Methyltransferase 2D [Friedmanniomyces endolithicus]